MLTRLFLLLVSHCVCDYPLQGDFLAQGKRGVIPGVPAWVCLLAHSFIHGGGVFLVTGNLWAAVAEVVLHYLIDWGKCAGQYSLVDDQALHVICKVYWVLS